VAGRGRGGGHQQDGDARDDCTGGGSALR
jgi:hypothetical protein